MANGTIAFDTLSTSGQISGTAVSVDTDYLAYGSAKVWCDLDGTGTIALDNSLNCASATDNGTGNYTIAYTNNMGNANYSLVGTGMNRAVVIITSRAAGNTNFYTQDHNDGTNEKDSDPTCLQIMGELA